MSDVLDSGRIFVDFVPRLKAGFGKAMEEEAGGSLSKVQGLAKKAGIGIAAGLFGVAAGVVGIGLKVGETFEKAYNTISVGTGKTGKELEGLKASFRSVLAGVPDDAATVADAMTKIATRTDLTGKPLESLTTKLLTLSRITKTDLNGNIDGSVKLFAKWNIATNDQGKTLDYLFRISQKTGIGITDLQSGLVKFGAPLQELGYSLPQSAALLGQLSKAGVPATVAMTGLRKELSAAAKAGRDPRKTLDALIVAIRGAKNPTDAIGLAVRAFGTKAGPELAAAIRKGAFSVDDLAGRLGKGGDSIEAAAARTETFGVKMDKLKNKLSIALAPLGAALIDGVGKLADKFGPLVARVGQELPGAFARLGAWIRPVVKAISDFVHGFLIGTDRLTDPQTKWAVWGAQMHILWDTKVRPALEKIVAFLREHWKPVLIAAGIALGLLTAPVTTVVAALVFAYTKWSWFRTAVNATISWLIRNVPPAFHAVQRAIATAIGWISRNVVPVVVRVVAGIVSRFSALVGWVRKNWPAIREAIGHVIVAIHDVIAKYVSIIEALWRRFGSRILSTIARIWDVIVNVVKIAINLVKGIIETVTHVINGDWGKAWDSIKHTFAAVWGGLWKIVKDAFSIVQHVLSIALGGLGTLIGKALDGIVGYFEKLPGRLVKIAGHVFDFLWSAFKWALDQIIKAWNGLEFKIPGFKLGPVKFGGFTLGVPDIPLLADGGHVVNMGSVIVGERGPEILNLPRGATVLPLDGALGAAGDSGKLFETLAVDARGIEDPLAVADYTSRVVAWRTRARRPPTVRR